MVNIDQLPELKGIAENGKTVVIGANQKINEVKENSIVQKHFPALVEAISTIGAKQTRMRGSLAGNIANASPSADSLPPLVAYGAKVLLVSQNGERTVDVDKFIEQIATIHNTQHIDDNYVLLSKEELGAKGSVFSTLDAITFYFLSRLSNKPKLQFIPKSQLYLNKCYNWHIYGLTKYSSALHL